MICSTFPIRSWDFTDLTSNRCVSLPLNVQTSPWKEKIKASTWSSRELSMVLKHIVEGKWHLFNVCSLEPLKKEIRHHHTNKLPFAFALLPSTTNCLRTDHWIDPSLHSSQPKIVFVGHWHTITLFKCFHDRSYLARHSELLLPLLLGVNKWEKTAWCCSNLVSLRGRQRAMGFLSPGQTFRKHHLTSGSQSVVNITFMSVLRRHSLGFLQL